MKRQTMPARRQKFDLPKYPLVYRGQSIPNRKFECKKYDKCLDVAAMGNWLGWECPKKCRGYREKTALEIYAEDRAIKKAIQKGN